MGGKHQRVDGTWTFTTPEWDATWYWPVGTRVRVATRNGPPVSGTVTKENSTTVRIQFDPESTYGTALVPKRALVRETTA